jgi:hypothetical protein
MVWTPPRSGKRGRQQQFSDAVIRACLIIARQGIVESNVLRGAEGPVWHAAPSDNWVRPKFAAFGRVGLGGTGFHHLMSTTARQAIAKQSAQRGQRTLNVSLPYRGSKGPLNLLISFHGL